MLKIQKLNIPGFEKVIEAIDPASNLHSIIAIHNTKLGPALGGVRILPYPSFDDALTDVLRLARGMTYKSAVAANGLGGGKSVIIADQKDKNIKLLRAFGKVVDSLAGEYIAAEDVGSSIEDMGILHNATPYVAAYSHEKSSKDPSRFTAWGVFRGIQAVAKTLWGTTSLYKRTIAIQGLGSVGGKLANILFWEGATLILSDIDEAKLHEHALLFGAKTISPEDFCSEKCDILSPCALGGIINPKSIEKMECKSIAGAANNQLLDDSCGELLMKKNILYAPDYIINAGGIINAAAEFDLQGYKPVKARDKVNEIKDILLHLFIKAAEEGKPTNQVADELAEYNLLHSIGKRQHPIQFH
ncbi:MAG: Glu/Leu/Phe/Val dehydrogenase [Parachlamydiaceae bacterium]|nr:Glu/Leu/Phe/Val dehydrogenase [Parachlamydiaceae bacterium]